MYKPAHAGSRYMCTSCTSFPFLYHSPISCSVIYCTFEHCHASVHYMLRLYTLTLHTLHGHSGTACQDGLVSFDYATSLPTVHSATDAAVGIILIATYIYIASIVCVTSIKANMQHSTLVHMVIYLCMAMHTQYVCTCICIM